MRFLAIDLETANADRSSICAIGAVLFENGEPAHEWYSLVDPEDYFDWINVEIHGIDEEQVRGAPKFPQAFENILSISPTGIAVSHTSFDPVAIRRATEKHRCQPWEVQWLDSARVARRAWPDRFAESGYGLASVAKFLGIAFQHHNALEDARASGQIICQAVAVSGLSVEEWLDRVCKPISPEASKPIRLDGNPEGPFSGESITFTGALVVPRREAAEMAARIGFNVLSGVSKKTSVLVVGDQDARKLHGHSISSKHQKAEGLIKSGHPIQIITEADFFDLVGMTAPAKPKARPVSKGRSGSPEPLAVELSISETGELSMSLVGGPPESDVQVSDGEIDAWVRQYSFVLGNELPSLSAKDRWWEYEAHERRVRKGWPKVFDWLRPFIAEKGVALAQEFGLCEEGLRGLNPALVKLRAMIRERRRQAEPFDDLMKVLYGLAVLNDFVKSLEAPQWRSHMLTSMMAVDDFAGVAIDYRTMGYDKVRSLGKTDVKWLVECFGEPDGHQDFDDLWPQIRRNAISRYWWVGLRDQNKSRESLGHPVLTMTEHLKDWALFYIRSHKEWLERTGGGR